MTRLLHSLSVRTQLLAGFGVVLALTLLMSLVAFRQMGNIETQVESLASHSMPQLVAAGALQAANQQIAVSVRDVVSVESLAGQKEATKDLKTAKESFQKSLADAQQAGSDGPHGALLKKIADDYKAITPMIEEVMTMVDEANIDHARSFVFEKLRPKQVALSADMAELVKAEAAQARQRAEASEAAYHSATRQMALIVVVALILGGWLAWIVTRGIVLPLRKSVEFAAEVARGDFSRRVRVDGHNEITDLLAALNSMTQQLADTVAQIRHQADRTAGYAQQLSTDSEQAQDRSQAQVDRVMAMTAAVEQMSVSIREVSNSAEGVSAAALRAQSLSQSGNEKMEHNRREIDEIVRLVDVSGAIIGDLSSAITEVSAITKVIKEIADQTNLLALNAAIEAARAGEQGRGFAVVADEVRKLAERTTKSTAEIANMLATIDGKAGETVSAMQRVRSAVENGARDTGTINTTLQEIVAAAAEVSSLVSGIAAATQEQARSTETTAQGIEAISALTDETNGTILRVRETATEMNAVSSDLQQLVGKFRT